MKPTARDLIAEDARKRLRYKQQELAEAVANENGDATSLVLIRRAEKGIGTYTAKVLCDHQHIVNSEFRANGYTVYAYACTSCKTRITSRLPL